MSNNKKRIVFSAMRSMMKPIVLLLLRSGITYKEFAAACKSIFIEAALEEFGIRGRPTNTSRIAVLTGIDRKEVKRIRDLLDDNPDQVAAQTAQDRITRLLTAWHQHQEFQNADGTPKVLAVAGAPASFETLVRRFGGDVPAQALLKELERLGLVEIGEQGVRVLSRDYFPARNDPAALLRAGSVIAELASTLHHNLHQADPSRAGHRYQPRFERRASNNCIDARHRKAFREYLAQEGQAFLERVDAWLSQHELAAGSAGEAVRLSVGLYSSETIFQGDAE